MRLTYRTQDDGSHQILRAIEFDQYQVEQAGLELSKLLKESAKGLLDVEVGVACGYFDEDPYIYVQGWSAATPAEEAEIQKELNKDVTFNERREWFKQLRSHAD